MTANPRRRHSFLASLSVSATLFILSSFGAAQAYAPAATQNPWAQDLQKYPGLMQEFQTLLAKLQTNVQAPPLRSESKLLPSLPGSTLYFAALPNYGPAVRQSLDVFHHELQQSAILRDWWQHGELAKNGPLMEQAIDKFSQLSEYLGDEIVVSGDAENSGSLLILAQIQKPGLKEFLQQMFKEMGSKSNTHFRVLSPEDLASIDDHAAGPEFVVLVRRDLVLAAPDIKALRSFNTLLDSNTRQFAATPFGQRLTQCYRGGASVLVAADLHDLLQKVPAGAAQQQQMLERTGFGDMKYLVWERKTVTGQTSSQTELSFMAPRHGVASWLASPEPMNSLTFVSPEAIISTTLVLKNFAQIFDDIKELSSYSNPNASASVDQMQQAMNLNLKQDLLDHFNGEITFALESFVPPDPVWKAILRVNDPVGLQRTLNKLLPMAQVMPQQSQEDGITYYTLHIPSPKKTIEIVYSFVDQYLIMASSHDAALSAVQAHKTGKSLAKSPKLLAAQPSSALFYEDPIAISAITLRQASPQMAEVISRASSNKTSVVISAYGEEKAIRVASANGGADVGAILVGAAIAIPNLLRARIAANETSATATIRAIDVAEITYASTYPRKGYAVDLASLGPDPHGSALVSARHASLIEPALGSASCTAGTWCTKSGFQFTMKAVCGQTTCKDFVVVATPVSSNTGSRSFCSTSDGVVRFNLGPPLAAPLTASQCRAWSPLQ